MGTRSKEERAELEGLYRDRVATQAEYFDAGYPEQWERLATRLLSFGGMLVVPPILPETSVAELAEHGRLFPIEQLDVIAGEPSSCHANAARLWESGAGDIASGYGLSEDGLWRQHSWLVAGTSVIETTVPRVAYYGLVLTNDQAHVFALQNPSD